MSQALVRTTPVQLMLALEEAGAVTDTSLVLNNPEMTFEQFEALGVFFYRVKRATSWWVGDWINHGERLFGDLVYQAVDDAGLHPETVKQYRHVCEKIPRSRRVEKLGFGHHVLVCNLEADQQTHWLREAVRNKWRENDLRHEMQEAGVAKRRPEPFLHLEPLFDGSGEPLPVSPLREVADAILRDARPHDDGQHFLVPSEDIARLKAVLNEEE